MTEAADEREPDYRFTLANERTLLSWYRTSIALAAAGFALTHVVTLVESDPRVRALGAVFLVLASLVPTLAWKRWRRVQSAMRKDDPLPENRLVVVLGGALTCAVLALVALQPWPPT